jgi:hypothetical protein
MAVNNSSRQPLLFAHPRCHALTVRLGAIACNNGCALFFRLPCALKCTALHASTVLSGLAGGEQGCWLSAYLALALRGCSHTTLAIAPIA